ncbi:hypothetical protein OSTOST_14559 [Ostertagia ostertagi]
MNLREYASNATELNKLFEVDDGSIAQIQKLLSFRWNIHNDEMIISLPRKPPAQTKWTKRKVLKEVASIYDRWVFCHQLHSLENFSSSHCGKDDGLSDDLATHSQHAIEPANTSDFDLHIFTDAPANAYCAVAYLVQPHVGSPHKVSLAMAKSRLAPLHQSVIIPRLELLTLVIGAELLTFLSTQIRSIAS